MPWFTAGLLLASFALSRDRQGARPALLACAMAALCGVGAIVTYSLTPFTRVGEFLAAESGISLTIGLASALSRTRVMTYLGKASLSIYLLHAIFSAGLREISEVVFPLDPLVLLLLTVAVGLIIPVAIHELANRTGIAPYVGLGNIARAPVGDRRNKQQPAG